MAHYKILSDAVEKCGADEGYDSSNDDCNPYFISIFDAEDDLCALLGVEPQNLISKKYEIETDVYPCDRRFPIEVEKVEIVEFDYKEED